MKNKKGAIRNLGLVHIIMYCYGCNNSKLNNSKVIRDSLQETARIGGLKVINTKIHKFDPEGITGYIIISESHISIHTWPEFSFAAIEVFTCKEDFNNNAMQVFKKYLAPKKVKIFRSDYKESFNRIKAWSSKELRKMH